MTYRTPRAALTLTLMALLLAIGARTLAAPQPQPAAPTRSSPVTAVIAVEKAIVFAAPDRTSAQLLTVYERERFPVLAQHPGGVFLLIVVETVPGWVLKAQVDLEGDLALIPVLEAEAALRLLTGTPAAPASLTPLTATPTAPPTRTPLPTRTPDPAGPTRVPTSTLSTTPEEALLQVLPGVPPPVTLTLPVGWESLDWVVPILTLDNEVRDIPLTIYFGPLQEGVYGLIYLYWGFPNTVDWVTGDYNLWADGVQLLRGSLVGRSCTLGLYDQQTFSVGGVEGVGANYQSSNCTDEADTAGWFVVVRAYEGTFAFYMAVEPWSALPDQRAALQAILDTVEFLPPEALPALTATPAP